MIIKRLLRAKIAETQSQNTKENWAYKLTVDQVSLIFETGDISIFGSNKEKKYAEFIEQYSALFNNSFDRKKINDESFRFKLLLKQQKLIAMHEAITSCDAPNSKDEFKIIFGVEYKSIDDLKLIIDRYKTINDKLSINTETKPESLTFEEVVNMVETSRGIPINRDIKLYSFYVMYKTELKKWQNG